MLVKPDVTISPETKEAKSSIETKFIFSGRKDGNCSEDKIISSLLDLMKLSKPNFLPVREFES